MGRRSLVIVRLQAEHQIGAFFTLRVIFLLYFANLLTPRLFRFNTKNLIILVIIRNIFPIIDNNIENIDELVKHTHNEHLERRLYPKQVLIVTK